MQSGDYIYGNGTRDIITSGLKVSRARGHDASIEGQGVEGEGGLGRGIAERRNYTIRL